MTFSTGWKQTITLDELPPKKPISSVHINVLFTLSGRVFLFYWKSSISFNIKVNEGWVPVIYMGRLILICPIWKRKRFRTRLKADVHAAWHKCMQRKLGNASLRRASVPQALCLSGSDALSPHVCVRDASSQGCDPRSGCITVRETFCQKLSELWWHYQ